MAWPAHHGTGPSRRVCASPSLRVALPKQPGNQTQKGKAAETLRRPPPRWGHTRCGWRWRRLGAGRPPRPRGEQRRLLPGCTGRVCSSVRGSASRRRCQGCATLAEWGRSPATLEEATSGGPCGWLKCLLATGSGRQTGICAAGAARLSADSVRAAWGTTRSRRSWPARTRPTTLLLSWFGSAPRRAVHFQFKLFKCS